MIYVTKYKKKMKSFYECMVMFLHLDMSMSKSVRVKKLLYMCLSQSSWAASLQMDKTPPLN